MNRRTSLRFTGAIGLSGLGSFCLVSSRAWDRFSQEEDPTRSSAPERGSHSVLLDSQRPKERFSAVAFSPDGRLLLAAGSPFFYQTVDIASLDGSGREPRIKTRGPNPILHMWNARTGRVAREYPAYLTDITAVGFNSQGTRVLTAQDARYVAAREWIRKNTTDRRLLGFTGQELLARPEGGLVKVWSALTGEGIPYPPMTHEDTLVYVAAGRQNITAVDERGNVRVWDATSGRPRAIFNNPYGRSPERGLYTPAISPDAARIVIQYDAGRSARFDLDAGSGHQWKDSGDSCNPIVFTPDGDRFATWSLGGRPLLWDFKTMKLVRAFRPGDYGPGSVFSGARGRAMAFSPDGARLAFAWSEGSEFQVKDLLMHVCTWDVASGRCLGETRATGNRVRALALTPQGDLRVAIGGDNLGDPNVVVPLSVWHVPRH